MPDGLVTAESSVPEGTKKSTKLRMHYGSTGTQQPTQGFPAAQSEGEEAGLVFAGQKKYGVRSSSVSVKPPQAASVEEG